jgi:hypothetical protein
MSEETDSTPSMLSTAARAFLAVPPQTTPGVWSTWVTFAANAPEAQTRTKRLVMTKPSVPRNMLFLLVAS